MRRSREGKVVDLFNLRVDLGVELLRERVWLVACGECRMGCQQLLRVAQTKGGHSSNTRVKAETACSREAITSARCLFSSSKDRSSPVRM